MSIVNVVSVTPLTTAVVLALTVPPLANMFEIVLTGSLQNNAPEPFVNNCCPLVPSAVGYTCVPSLNADVSNDVKQPAPALAPVVPKLPALENVNAPPTLTFVAYALVNGVPKLPIAVVPDVDTMLPVVNADM